MNSLNRLHVSSPPRRQGGAVLMVALIFLVVLTLLGLSAMDTTVMEVKLARNTQEHNYAFQMAETAISEYDLLLDDTAILGGLYTSGRSSPAVIDPVERYSKNGHVIKSGVESGDGTLTDDKFDPELEFLGIFDPPPSFSVEGTNSLTEVDVAYFEAVAVGTNFENDDTAMRVIMREGHRRAVPAAGGSGNTTTITGNPGDYWGNQFGRS